MITFITCTTGMSQQATRNQNYWVVETHTRDTVYSVVRFFDSTNTLMHEVRIDHVAVDIKQKKHRKLLDQLLSDYSMRMSRSMKKIRSRTSV